MAASTGGYEPMKNTRRVREADYRGGSRKSNKPQRGGKHEQHSEC